MIAAIDPMTALRPLHLPPAPPLWPPAPGWWLVASLCLAALAIAYVLYRRRKAPRRHAMAELAAIRAGFERNGDGGHARRQVSRLLKRVAISADGRERVAALTGEAWLAYLVERGGAPFLENGVAAVFGREMYRTRAPESEELEHLFEAAGRWIGRVLK